MTTSAAWLVEVFFHEGRFHGEPEWPPSPARLFQALVAGAASSARIGAGAEACLRWLESLPAPLVGAPIATQGQDVKAWVPNNDLDAKGGDPAAVATIRTAKSIRPRLFDSAVPVLYAWSIEPGHVEAVAAESLGELAASLYQLGRGVDAAWARGSLVSQSQLDERLERYRGELHHPTQGQGTAAARALDCPTPGSLDSLVARHNAMLKRFARDDANKRRILFQQPPKARFARVPYDSRPLERVYELRVADGRFAQRPLTGVAPLVEAVRDAAAGRLKQSMPERAADIERALVGRTPDGAARLRSHRRVRIIPLPSIGHRFADRAVRRVIVQVPAGCPLDAADVNWALSGLELDHGPILVPTDDYSMLKHFGSDRPARLLRSVTPLALPDRAARRRVDPVPTVGDTKGAPERAEEEARAVHAVRQALRHAGVQTKVLRCRVQREPYEGRGQRAEPFAEGTRFAKERLWHAELLVDTPLRGPLLLGDGRFLGLGLMAPVRGEVGVAAFRIVDGWSESEPMVVARALRRAVMSRYQNEIGKRELPPFVSGHDADGSPAKDGRHLYFVADPTSRTVMILPPHVRDHRQPLRIERQHLEVLESSLLGFERLNAGRAGRLELERTATEPDFPVASVWRSATPYLVDRHRKSGTAASAVEFDVRASCRAAGLAVSAVEVAKPRGVPGLGLTADVTLHFAKPTSGPIALGRNRFQGGGWFVPA